MHLPVLIAGHSLKTVHVNLWLILRVVGHRDRQYALITSEGRHKCPVAQEASYGEPKAVDLKDLFSVE